MSEKLPISALVALATAISLTANATDAIFEDGQVSLVDLPKLPSLLSGLKSFASVEFAQLLPQIADLDEQEKYELADAFREKFNIRNEGIEEVIEIGFALSLEVSQVFQVLKSIGSKIKG